MEREVFDDLWDKADREYRSQGNNSFTFKHHLFAVLDDKLKVQPKLSIPKKIAELADKYVDKYGFCQIDKDDALELTVAIDCPEERIEAELIYDYADKNPALLTAYLTSKALGVELVSIEED